MKQFTPEIKLKSSSEQSYFDQLVGAFIRPPRQTYDVSRLGPTTIIVNKLMIFREDFIVLSRQPQIKLQCSLYSPVIMKDKPRGCIIYLHGNSSSRLESNSYAHMICSEGLSLINFDFGGSGISEGEYVSLGWHEKTDFLAVLEYAKQRHPELGPFGIWGRSMGAVTAVMAALETKITTLVLDSPFCNLKQLCMDIGDDFHVPSLGVRFAFYMVRKKIRTLVNYDPKLLATQNYIKQLSRSSIMFLRASGDRMITQSHVDMLYQMFKGEKFITIFEGDHNSGRPIEVYQSIIRFFVNRLKVPMSSMPTEKTPQKIQVIQQEDKSSKQTNVDQFNLFESEPSCEELDEGNKNRHEHDKYVSDIRMPRKDSEDSLEGYEEDIDSNQLPQFQSIHCKHR